MAKYLSTEEQVKKGYKKFEPIKKDPSVKALEDIRDTLTTHMKAMQGQEILLGAEIQGVLRDIASALDKANGKKVEDRPTEWKHHVKWNDGREADITTKVVK